MPFGFFQRKVLFWSCPYSLQMWFPWGGFCCIGTQTTCKCIDTWEFRQWQEWEVAIAKVWWGQKRRPGMYALNVKEARILKMWWMLIIHYQKNANQNHNEVPSHASQNGCYQKVYKQMLERIRRKGNPLTLLVGMQTSRTTMENSVEIPLKPTNRTAIWPSNPTVGHTH